MTEDHAKAIALIRELKRVNQNGRLVLALDDELRRARAVLDAAIPDGRNVHAQSHQEWIVVDRAAWLAWREGRR